jgi:Methyltransferase domain
MKKSLLSKLNPNRLRQLLIRGRDKYDAPFSKKSLQETFSEIYLQKTWGGESVDFFSGDGSHDPHLVSVYVAAVRQFLAGFNVKVPVVDLGCGDFNVGRQLTSYVSYYVACDVVSQLIERNRARFAEPHLVFRCMDITKDPLPSGEVVFLRQVLQHLSNREILQVIAKLSAYKFLVLTEHLPANPVFAPNLDKPHGAGIRLGRGSGSGVVLTSPPFNLQIKSEQVLCEVSAYGGVIRTSVYELQR